MVTHDTDYFRRRAAEARAAALSKEVGEKRRSRRRPGAGLCRARKAPCRLAAAAEAIAEDTPAIPLEVA